jgi:hypothetical protein
MYDVSILVDVSEESIEALGKTTLSCSGCGVLLFLNF